MQSRRSVAAISLLLVLFLTGRSPGAEPVASSAEGEEPLWLPGTMMLLTDEINCEVLDVDGLIINVDVYHTFHPGATGVRFRVGLGPGAAATYLGETVHFEDAVGNTQDGIFVCYGGCTPEHIRVATIQYMLSGQSEHCSDIRVLPFPGADGPEGLGCDGEIGLTTAYRFLLHRDDSWCYSCSAEFEFTGTPTEGLSCMTVPVEATTWGAIKSLYE